MLQEVREVAPRIHKKVSAGVRRVDLHEHEDYYGIERLLRSCLQELDATTEVMRYSLQVINMDTGKGLDAQWTYNAGFVTETEQEPRVHD